MLLTQFVSQTCPPKPKFSVDQIPDLSSQVIIVTGGNTGVGKETIRALLRKNAKVYLAARSKEKAEAAIAELKADTAKEAIFLELDLSSFASIRKSAAEFLGKERELNVLFNNAGVMWCPKELLTAEGYDLQFGTNVIGHFLYTELLMPALLVAVQTSPDKHARVVTTSSFGAYLSDPMHWDAFEDGPVRNRLSTEKLYYQSKLGNFIVAREVAKRYGDQGIISTACNPGNLNTDLGRYMDKLTLTLFSVILYPAPYGALTQLWAGTMPEGLKLNGEFLIPWARVGKGKAEGYDPEVGERLWTWLQEQAKKHP